MTPKRWARVRRSGAHGLRRGAWYAVVNDSKPSLVFLDVNKKNVAVDRSLLEFSEVKPWRWSVVNREDNDDASKRASDASLNPTYGVCPGCRGRGNIVPEAERATCDNCRGDFLVDWDNPC